MKHRTPKSNSGLWLWALSSSWLATGMWIGHCSAEEMTSGDVSCAAVDSQNEPKDVSQNVTDDTRAPGTQGAKDAGKTK